MRSLRRLFPALLLLAAAVSVTSALAAPAPVAPQTRDAPSAPAAYQPRIKPYADEFGAVFSILSSGLLIAGFCLSAWLLVREWRRNPLVIEPFDVPKEMQDAGLTGAVLSQKLFDAILELQRNARPDDGPADIAFVELPRLQVDLQLPGMSWSIRGAIRYFKQALGRSDRRLVGEVLKSGRAYGLRLRSSTGRAVDVPARFHGASDLPATLTAAAEAAMALTDPLETASILYSMETPRTGYARTLEAIRLQLATGPARTHQDAYVLWASVCRALGDRAGMDAQLTLAKAANVSTWTGAPTGRVRPRYLNFTGNLLREARRLTEAEEVFLAAHGMDRNNVGAMTNLGLVYLEMDDLDKARRWFRRLIRIRPTSSRGYRGLGLLAAREGDWAGSVRWLSRAVDVAPRARWPRVNRIESLRVVGALDTAEKEVQAFLEDDAEFAPLYRFQSRIAADREDLRAALALAQHATEVDPTDAWGFVEVARIAGRLGRHEDVHAAVERALALRPGLPDAYRCRAAALAARGDIDGAERAFLEGAEADPGDLWCLLELSDLWRNRGLHGPALEACARALERKPRDANALRRWSWILRDRGDLPGAESKLREALATAPMDTVVRRDLAEILRRQGRFAASIELAEETLRHGVRPGLVHWQIARTLLARHDAAAAERRLRLAIESAPGDLTPRYELLDLLRRQERYQDALRVAQETASRFPSAAGLLRQWAWLLRDSGDLVGAAAKLDQAVDAAPHDVDGLIESADFLRERGALRSATERADQAVVRRPDLAAAWRCQARALGALGERSAAEAALRAAQAAAPGDVWTRADLCGTLRRWGRLDDAARTAEELTRVRPDSPEGWLQWAWTCERAGDAATAERKFEAAIGTAPPGDAHARVRHAAFLIDGGRLDEAVAQTRQVLEDDPLSIDAMRVLFRAQTKDPKTADEAIETVARWAAVAPHEIEPFILLAGWHVDNGRPGDALAALETAVQRRPTSLRVRREILWIHIDGSSWDEAERVLDELCGLAPAAVDDLVTWARALEKRDVTLSRSRAALERALARQPRSPLALQSWSRLLSRLGHASESERALRQAIEASPWDADLLLELADRLERAHRRPEAILILQAAQGLRRSPRLLRRLARMLLAAGQQSAGEEALARLTEVTPATEPRPLLDLADTAREYGRIVEALDAVRRAAELGPPDASVLHRAGNIAARCSDLPTAIRYLRAARDREPGSDDIANDLAEALFRAGDHAAARGIAMEVLARRPGDATARYVLQRTAPAPSRPGHP